MATLNKRKDGKKISFYVQLTAKEDPARPKISLGNCTLKNARTARDNIDELINSKDTGGKLTPSTTDWINNITDGLRDRLEQLHLVSPREGSRWTVEAFVSDYIDKRTDVKESTKRRMRDVEKRLKAFFRNTPLESVTVAQAKEYKIYLKSVVGLGENTARRNIGIVRQFFNSAIDAKIISENPFYHKELPVTLRPNESKFYYVTLEEALKVLDACPDAEWRLIFGLARFGGLRCPTEILRLKWEDIDFEHDRFIVHATKTEHCSNEGIREVPMFPELKPLFQDVFDQAKEGSVYCITKYRDNNVNLRTHLTRIITRAGLTAWPKLFQNCRSTRETELFRLTNGNIKAVCSWIGNSPAVALKHYAQLTDTDMKEAAKKSVIDTGKNRVQIRVHSSTISGCNGVQEENLSSEVNQ